MIQRHEIHLKGRSETFIYYRIDHAGNSWLVCGTYLQSFCLGQLGSHNKENEEISGGAVSHNTEFSPQLHALNMTFHIEINVVGLQLVFCC